ncbi:MAG: methyltransferase domain-containing protein [Elusimicrobiota bacterium]
MPMSELASVYDRDFFREWGRNNAAYVASAKLITEVLLRHLSARRIVDVGCGCGVYGHFFRERGVAVVSIDGVRPPPEESFPGEIEIRDLTVPFDNVWGAFDLALCFEVAEHIPERLCEPFLENLARFSDTLLLSAAPPNQGGRHHVNEQPKRYWVEKLARHGLAYNRKRTGVLLEVFKREKPPHMWMCQQVCLYERVRPS